MFDGMILNRIHEFRISLSSLIGFPVFWEISLRVVPVFRKLIMISFIPCFSFLSPYSWIKLFCQLLVLVMSMNTLRILNYEFRIISSSLMDFPVFWESSGRVSPELMRDNRISFIPFFSFLSPYS